MKVLYLTYDGLTDNLGQSQILPYVFCLQQAGHRFHIISCEKPINFNARYPTIQTLLQQHKVTHTPLFYTKHPPVLSTILDVIKLLRNAKQLHAQHQFEVVHCRSYITALVGLYMKRKYGTKFVFDMRGFWANERVDGNLWQLSNPLYKWVYNYFKRKEEQFVQESDAVVSLTHAGLIEMQRWNYTPTIETKTSIIPCCADFNHFKPMPYNTALAKELNILPTQQVLCYLGSLGTWYLLNEMLLLFKTLLAQQPNYVFLLITTDDPNLVWNACATHHINNQHIRITKANREQIPAYLSLVDWGVSFIKPSYSKLSSSPTKMAEMYACGIPLVCNAGVGDVAVINKLPLGVTLPTLNQYNYNEACVHITATTTVDKQAVRLQAQQQLSLEYGAQLYIKMYAQL